MAEQPVFQVEWMAGRISHFVRLVGSGRDDALATNVERTNRGSAEGVPRFVNALADPRAEEMAVRSCRMHKYRCPGPWRRGSIGGRQIPKETGTSGDLVPMSRVAWESS
ncbi:hypothetical protein R1flu_017743 [Riccia fluitans]|uniref:Uncharacterized protein n=1 Tax=Riccia fluitans TaxID=41844 RepID=A0ABD1ZE48_9MARC